MNSFKCQECLNYFNSKTRQPRTLKCGHSFCLHCLSKNFIDGHITCLTCGTGPTDMNKERYQDLEEYPIDRKLNRFIETQEVYCVLDNDTIATHFDPDSFTTYCDKCLQHPSTPISLESLRPFLLETLARFKSFRLPDSLYNKFNKLIESSKPDISNKDLLHHLRELKLVTEHLCCQKHELTEAHGFDLKTRDLLCKACIKKDKTQERFSLISSPGFKMQLLTKIIWLRRSNIKLNVLTENYEELKTKSIKDLLTNYKLVDSKYFNSIPSLKTVLCNQCKSDYTPENPPYVFNCIGGYTICKSCKDQNEEVFCQFCENQMIRHKTFGLELFFGFFNSVPLCSFCKSPYDLKGKLPKELPCKHILCLDCVHHHYIRNNQMKCRSCDGLIEKPKILKSNFFIVNQVLRNLVYCEKHKGRGAVCVEVKTLRPWCRECFVLASEFEVKAVVERERALRNVVFCRKHSEVLAVYFEKIGSEPCCAECFQNKQNLRLSIQITSPVCETHKSAILYIETSGKANCLICISSRKSLFYNIEDAQATRELFYSIFSSNYEKSQQFRDEVRGGPEWFMSLTSQEMIDEIRTGFEPNIKSKLRSKIPSGRILYEIDSKLESFVTRFYSLMPPTVKDNEHSFLCQPWKVDEKNGQIEAITFKVNKNIKLKGVVLGKTLYNTKISIDLIEIIKGPIVKKDIPRIFHYPGRVGEEVSISNKLQSRKNSIVSISRMNSDEQRVQVSAEFLQNQNQDEVFILRVDNFVDITADEYFTLLIRFRGAALLLYRGNPFDLKEEIWGSDGTVFQFFEVENDSRHKIIRQHRIHGPILGFLYDSN